FAYIAQNQQSENLECHAFLCPKRKMTRALSVGIAPAASALYIPWHEKKEKREKSSSEGDGASGRTAEDPVGLEASVVTGNLLDLEDAARSPSPGGARATCLGALGPRVSSENNNVVWEMDDGLEEAFSRLAQSRTNPHVLDTGLTAQDLQNAEPFSPVDWDRFDSHASEQEDLFGF
uniref:Low density lipoprotein receptor adaptor protein 1 n=1 Tax=Pelodiscus sinensis TaxID=13735 RepID=K7FLI8_PELSI